VKREGWFKGLLIRMGLQRLGIAAVLVGARALTPSAFNPSPLPPSERGCTVRLGNGGSPRWRRLDALGSTAAEAKDAKANAFNALTNVIVQSMPKVPDEVDVVITHTMCDFDALASAVGLAKVWSHDEDIGERRVYVVLPRGAHPNVESFLSLHQNLFPIRRLKWLTHEIAADRIKVRRAGMVDCQRRDRIGHAAALLDVAEDVVVVDHHVDKETDVDATKLQVEHVGSVTTIVTEMLRERNIGVTDAEATLMALGIHADTGSLVFDSAGPRDAHSLAWLMDQGVSQIAVSEYSQGAMSELQQKAMFESIRDLKTVEFEGLKIGSVVVRLDEYVNGLSTVAQNLLELANVDVVLMAGVYSSKGVRKSKRKKKRKGKKDTSNTSKSAKETRIEAAEAKAKAKVAKLKTGAAAEQATQMKAEAAAAGAKEKVGYTRAGGDGGNVVAAGDGANEGADNGLVTAENANDAIRAMMIGGFPESRPESTESAAVAEEAAAVTEEQVNVVAPVQEDLDSFDHMIVVGRVRPRVHRSINLNSVFGDYGGGGHAKAASASFRLDRSAFPLNQFAGSVGFEPDELNGPQHQISNATSHASVSLADSYAVSHGASHDGASLDGDSQAVPHADADAGVGADSDAGADSDTDAGAHDPLELGHDERSGLAGQSDQRDSLGLGRAVLDRMVEEMKAGYESPDLTARDFMTAPVLTCLTTDSIEKIRKILEHKRIGCLPVVEPSDSSNPLGSVKDVVRGGRLVGLMTKQQVIRAEQLGWDITQKNVKSIMVNKNDVKTLTADTPLREIQQLLIDDDGVAGFPVLRKDGSVEGYITRTDLLRQQHYYKSLHYHNKGFSDNLKDREKWLMLRQKLKAFDIE